MDDDEFDDETGMTEAEFDRLWDRGIPTPTWLGPAPPSTGSMPIRFTIGGESVPPDRTIYFDFVTREVRY